MSRALVTFGTGEFADLLDISRPGLAAYAELHGYDLLGEPPQLLTRPPSWGKLAVLLDALADYDEVLWVDCDVVILDGSADLAEIVPSDAWQAITRHHTYEGEVPSTGVWYVRPEMREPLARMWEMTQYTRHPWWEQAALQDSLGYTPNDRPVRLDEPTELFDRTEWLDVGWNQLAPTPDTELAGIRFAHCGPGAHPTTRAHIMQSLIERSSREQVPA